MYTIAINDLKKYFIVLWSNKMWPFGEQNNKKIDSIVII